jgi:tRNA 5-methylaminomethyl-2-thiouridine biosynthesis bifunctional protein
MHHNPNSSASPQATLCWDSAGQPYSPRFGDVYHSRAGALTQARTVFLGGCGLPAHWQGRERYTVLETGFGLGLNFLATWAAWRQDARRCARLYYMSVEAFPVRTDDLWRSAQSLSGSDAAHAALQAEILHGTAALAQAWPGLRTGVQTLLFDEGRVALTLAVGDVQPMLSQLHEPADAVYLDGFSPARNPAMWSEATLAAVARLCRPGTRVASWCVAGAVRARLAALGFAVQRLPGLPPKRQRLQAVFSPGNACG